MKPASVMRAKELIKTGEVIEIAHVMNDKMHSSARDASACT